MTFIIYAHFNLSSRLDFLENTLRTITNCLKLTSLCPSALKTLIILSHKGFIESSGIERKLFSDMNPRLSLSMALKRLYRDLICSPVTLMGG